MSPMPGFNEKTWSERSGVLGVVMFAVLLVTVALAWWLTRVRLEPVHRGQEILERIRGKTLQAYWGAEPTTRWYLIIDPQGRPTGWWARLITPVAGGFSGTLIRYLDQTEFSIEQWELANDASSGEYRAAGESPGLVDTVIQLKAGRVKVVRQGKRGLLQASAPAPRNYIPEGMTSLALSEAARAGKAACFRIILNNLAIMGKEINFALVRVTPVQQGRARVEYEVRSLRGIHRSAQIYQLNAEGDIVSIRDEADRTTQKSVSPEEVFEHFPEAAKFLSPSSWPAGQEDPTVLRAEGFSREAPRPVG